MIDMSIPVIVGTVVAEVIVVVASFCFSNFLTRSDQMKFGLPSFEKTHPYGLDDAVQSSPPARKASYKDEKESYFDHSATATQLKFEKVTDSE